MDLVSTTLNASKRHGCGTDKRVCHVSFCIWLHSTRLPSEPTYLARVLLPLPAMSASSKQLMSGLGTVKRDFSSNTQVKREPGASQSQPKRSTISDTLRKAIEEGVASREAEARKATTTEFTPLFQKRTFPPQSSANVPPAKRRQLPRSWDDVTLNPSTSPSSWQPTLTSSASTNVNSSQSASNKSSQPPVISPVAPMAGGSKVAPIFLSKEQTHILQFVKDGESVFYTGSAGKSFLYPHAPWFILGSNTSPYASGYMHSNSSTNKNRQPMTIFRSAVTHYIRFILCSPSPTRFD